MGFERADGVCDAENDKSLLAAGADDAALGGLLDRGLVGGRALAGVVGEGAARFWNGRGKAGKLWDVLVLSVR